jgi:hypothetical protein
MSDPASPPAAPSPETRTAAEPALVLDPKIREHTEGFKSELEGEETVDRRLAEIEMIGEEAALGWKPAPHLPLSPEVRYLHVSRTINQLITDRNRSVGIFLGVASLLFASSTALLNARPDVAPIIPLRSIQYWCLPVTFGTLAVIGMFMCLILVRTRIGLIYEVTKMNALLGLPSERVKRVNPFSIFFLMYLMVALLGGACAGVVAGMLIPRPSAARTAVIGEPILPIEPSGGDIRVHVLAGFLTWFLYTALFLGLYHWMVLNATSDSKLEKARA